MKLINDLPVSEIEKDRKNHNEFPKYLSDEEKIALIQYHCKDILHILGLDLKDDSLKGTPYRMAKMFVKEVFKGLDLKNFPSISVFNNDSGYCEMLIEKDISLYSYCEHHFVPIIGKAHLAYFPGEKIIGLSKLNRIVHFYSKKPQVQEKLTMEIANKLKEILKTDDIAVFIEAEHLCISSRGVGDTNSLTKTSFYGGKFKKYKIKSEFLKLVKNT